MSSQMLEVSLLGLETVLRLARDAWSMVKPLRPATNEYAPPPTAPPANWVPCSPVPFFLAACDNHLFCNTGRGRRPGRFVRPKHSK